MASSIRIVPFEPTHQQTIYNLWWEGWEATLAKGVDHRRKSLSKKLAIFSAASAGAFVLLSLGDLGVASSFPSGVALATSEAAVHAAKSTAATIAIAGGAASASCLLPLGRRVLMSVAKRHLKSVLNASGNDDMYDIYRNWVQRSESRAYFTAVDLGVTDDGTATVSTTREGENNGKDKNCHGGGGGGDAVAEDVIVVGGAAVHIGSIGLPPAPGAGAPGAPKLSETDATLFRMVVASSTRRQGVAGKLLAVIEAHARNRGCRRVFATSANPVAVQCYEKYGYRVVYSFEMSPPGAKTAAAGTTAQKKSNDVAHTVKTLVKEL